MKRNDDPQMRAIDARSDHSMRPKEPLWDPMAVDGRPVLAARGEVDIRRGYLKAFGVMSGRTTHMSIRYARSSCDPSSTVYSK